MVLLLLTDEFQSTIPKSQSTKRMCAWKRHLVAGQTTLGATRPSGETAWPRNVNVCPLGQVTDALKRERVDSWQGDQCSGGGRSVWLPNLWTSSRLRRPRSMSDALVQRLAQRDHQEFLINWRREQRQPAATTGTITRWSRRRYPTVSRACPVENDSNRKSHSTPAASMSSSSAEKTGPVFLFDENRSISG